MPLYPDLYLRWFFPFSVGMGAPVYAYLILSDFANATLTPRNVPLNDVIDTPEEGMAVGAMVHNGNEDLDTNMIIDNGSVILAAHGSTAHTIVGSGGFTPAAGRVFKYNIRGSSIMDSNSGVRTNTTSTSTTYRVVNLKLDDGTIPKLDVFNSGLTNHNPLPAALTNYAAGRNYELALVYDGADNTTGQVYIKDGMDFPKWTLVYEGSLRSNGTHRLVLNPFLASCTTDRVAFTSDSLDIVTPEFTDDFPGLADVAVVGTQDWVAPVFTTTLGAVSDGASFAGPPTTNTVLNTYGIRRQHSERSNYYTIDYQFVAPDTPTLGANDVTMRCIIDYTDDNNFIEVYAHTNDGLVLRERVGGTYNVLASNALGGSGVDNFAAGSNYFFKIQWDADTKKVHVIASSSYSPFRHSLSATASYTRGVGGGYTQLDVTDIGTAEVYAKVNGIKQFTLYRDTELDNV